MNYLALIFCLSFKCEIADIVIIISYYKLYRSSKCKFPVKHKFFISRLDPQFYLDYNIFIRFSVRISKTNPLW